MPNKWITFVKEWSAENNMSYACAITDSTMKAAYYKAHPKTTKISLKKQKKAKEFQETMGMMLEDTDAPPKKKKPNRKLIVKLVAKKLKIVNDEIAKMTGEDKDAPAKPKPAKKSLALPEEMGKLIQDYARPNAARQAVVKEKSLKFKRAQFKKLKPKMEELQIVLLFNPTRNILLKQTARQAGFYKTLLSFIEQGTYKGFANKTIKPLGKPGEDKRGNIHTGDYWDPEFIKFREKCKRRIASAKANWILVYKRFDQLNGLSERQMRNTTSRLIGLYDKFALYKEDDHYTGYGSWSNYLFYPRTPIDIMDKLGQYDTDQLNAEGKFSSERLENNGFWNNYVSSNGGIIGAMKATFESLDRTDDEIIKRFQETKSVIPEYKAIIKLRDEVK
jgi:hypothetical protein